MNSEQQYPPPATPSTSRAPYIDARSYSISPPQVSVTNHRRHRRTNRTRKEGSTHLLRLIHLGISLSLILKDRIPSYNATNHQPSTLKPPNLNLKSPSEGSLTKRPRSPRWHNLPDRPPLKDQRFLSRPGGESECADSFGGFVGVGGEEVVEVGVGETRQEPFSMMGKRGG